MAVCIALFLLPLLALELHAGSPPGDVVGQLSVGYQGWFSAQGDGSPRGRWFHWSNTIPPSPGFLTFEIWPDMTEYTNAYQTGFANLRNGGPSRLFSSWDNQTINVHFKWMQQYNLNTAALQRFGANFGNPSERAHMTGIHDKAVAAAVTYGRKVYVMYDVSSWIFFQQGIRDDWLNVERWISSPAYARQNGKPVVCIWGFGFLDRPGDPNSALDAINFLKGKGLYVIGGVPKFWRTGLFSKPGFLPIYDAFDMISPWTIGSYGGVVGARDYQTTLRQDFQYLEQRGKDYQPVIYAGFAWSNWHVGSPRNAIPRIKGDFMWQQFVNCREIGIPNVYVAMFDEFDEGTAIAKAATTKNDVPNNQYFLTLDEDGTRMSSDFYMRLSNDGMRMVKGQTALQQTHTTPFF